MPKQSFQVLPFRSIPTLAGGVSHVLHTATATSESAAV